MTPTLILAAGFVAIAIGGVLALRRFSDFARGAFDIICFSAISAFLVKQGIAPLFPPLDAHVDSSAIWMRALAGAWWLLGARITVYGLRFAIYRDRHSSEAKLFSDLSGAVIYIATAFVVLNSVLAIPITGVVATSGVVAIVLGLALQNTLADVFAGIAVGVEAPFRVGDRILIGDKTEGKVVEINWRSIRVQTDGDDVSTVPNSVVAKAEIINRTYPLKRTASSVEFSYPAEAVPERVIETVLDATRLCHEILRRPAPSAFLTRLGERHCAYKITFTVDSASGLASTKDALLRGVRRQLLYAGLLERDGRISAAHDAALAPPLTQRLLADMVLFESLDREQIINLADKLQLQQIEAGEVLFAQGAEGATLYIVALGVLEVVRQGGAVSEVIGCIGAGDYIGEISLLTGAPHEAMAVAQTHCEIYSLTREAIKPLLSENPMLASSFDQSARRGLEILHREVAARATPSIGPRGQLLARIRGMFHIDPA